MTSEFRRTISNDNACIAASFAIIDVETTGLDPRRDRVVEVACVRMEAGTIIERFSTLIDPERPISATASAIHNIYDRDVVGAPKLPQVVKLLKRLTRGAVVVGHNVRFDLSFLTFLKTRPALCTLQLARRLVDAPDYRNETLRRVLRLGVPSDAPHRALNDAIVTSAILRELLMRHAAIAKDVSIPSVIEKMARPVRLERFTFGRYRDAKVASVPTGYLRWILDAGFEGWPDVRYTAVRELTDRGFAVRSV